MSKATLEPETAQASSVRILGKRIKLDKDYDPAGKDKDTVIRTAVPFEMKSLNDEERTIDFVGSTATRDRYGDSVAQTGWELGNFVKNPVIPWGHRYDEPPVAKAIEVGLRDGKLFFKGQWATADEYDFADTIYKLYKGGYLRAFSVGFIPLEWEIQREYDDDGALTDIWWEFTKCELLEVSCVTVPANPEALTLAFREGTLSTRDKGFMIGQAEKLIKSLTETDQSLINEGMNEETKAYIDEQFKSILDAIAELKDAEASDTEEEQPVDPANPEEDTSGGTEDGVTADELRSMVSQGLRDQLGIIE